MKQAKLDNSIAVPALDVESADKLERVFSNINITLSDNGTKDCIDLSTAFLTEEWMWPHIERKYTEHTWILSVTRHDTYIRFQRKKRFLPFDVPWKVVYTCSFLIGVFLLYRLKP